MIFYYAYSTASVSTRFNAIRNIVTVCKHDRTKDKRKCYPRVKQTEYKVFRLIYNRNRTERKHAGAKS